MRLTNTSLSSCKLEIVGLFGEEHCSCALRGEYDKKPQFWSVKGTQKSFFQWIHFSEHGLNHDERGLNYAERGLNYAERGLNHAG